MMELVTGGSGSGKSAYAEEALCRLSLSSDSGQGKVPLQDRQRYYMPQCRPGIKRQRKR